MTCKAYLIYATDTSQSGCIHLPLSVSTSVADAEKCDCPLNVLAGTSELAPMVTAEIASVPTRVPPSNHANRAKYVPGLEAPLEIALRTTVHITMYCPVVATVKLPNELTDVKPLLVVPLVPPVVPEMAAKVSVIPNDDPAGTSYRHPLQ
jgi:hypothetical protein